MVNTHVLDSVMSDLLEALYYAVVVCKDFGCDSDTIDKAYDLVEGEIYCFDTMVLRQYKEYDHNIALWDSYLQDLCCIRKATHSYVGTIGLLATQAERSNPAVLSRITDNINSAETRFFLSAMDVYEALQEQFSCSDSDEEPF